VTSSFAFEVGKLVYGLGLLAIWGAVLLALRRVVPAVLLVARELSSALREHSAALRGQTISPDVARQVAEIHAAVVRKA
jgi:hypothetical protein